MENWYNEYPGFLESEIRDLKDNGILVDESNLNSKIFDREGVKLTCIIPIENTLGLDLTGDLSLIIAFPSNYPYFRPEVLVISDTTLPRHQNPQGKNLCLIPRPTQYWNPKDGIYKYLKERLPIVFAKGKITDQEAIGMDPDEQAEPISEYYINTVSAVVFSARPKFENEELPKEEETFEILDHGFIQISHDSKEDRFKLNGTNQLKDEFLGDPKLDITTDTLKIVLEQWLGANERVLGEFPFKNIIKSGSTVKTKWYKINSLNKLLNRKDSFNWLMQELASKGIQQPKSLKIQINNYIIDRIVALLFPEEEIAGKIGWGWVLFLNGHVNRQKLSSPLSVPIVLPIMSIDQSDLFARIPQCQTLSDKVISIIGLGSLGAPSALEFAKNGVKELRLMDFDRVEVTSTVRWPLGIESVGMLKTVALKSFIEKNYPWVKVKLFHHKIGCADCVAFPNENEKLEMFLDGTDLLYDASAEEGISNLLSTLCWNKKIPYIEIEGRRGAWGGLVMRVLPEKKKGCWMCLQYSLYVDGSITPPKEDNNGTIQPKGCGDLTFTGASFDMQNISLAGVRMAVSTLGNEDKSGGWDVAVLSMVDAANQPIVPTWKAYSLEINPQCPICNAASLD